MKNLIFIFFVTFPYFINCAEKRENLDAKKKALEREIKETETRIENLNEARRKKDLIKELFHGLFKKDKEPQAWINLWIQLGKLLVHENTNFIAYWQIAEFNYKKFKQEGKPIPQQMEEVIATKGDEPTLRGLLNRI